MLFITFFGIYYKSLRFSLDVRAPIGQGYGLTETCAGAAFTEFDDDSVGRVGPPLPCGYIKVLINELPF